MKTSLLGVSALLGNNILANPLLNGKATRL